MEELIGMKRLKIDLKGTDLNISDALEMHKLEICDQIVEAVKYGLKTNQDNFVFLEIVSNNQTRPLYSKRDSWESALTKCIDHYVKVEAYEKCQECKDLIDKLNRSK